MSPAVYVLEPQMIFLPELSRIVTAAGGHVAQYADCFDVAEIASLRADFALLDLDSAPPGVIGGLAFFCVVAPRVRPIILTEQRSPGELARYRDAGAVAVLPKSVTALALAHSLRDVFGGEAHRVIYDAPPRVKTVRAEYSLIDTRC